ncbi:ABC-F family ATP-binding cassette domain-containing protein [Tardiphaga sp. 839_C3_N1_4]|jgi:ATPase subunit of ABC transporter with duplicated ATPase domains|uniref:ABC-F family ATP-binding cassette domain-containing protein n=1 Tax=Tardiphaga sp. 839_C3_N1_4 TaxID=3240761 RepID=UPI003F27B37E
MPAHITISDLSVATPDGRSLFTNLNLSFGAERAGLVGRNGVGKSTLLRVMSGNLAPHQGSVSVHGRLAVLRQALQLRPGEMVADLFGATDALNLLARAEAGTATAEELLLADWDIETRMARCLGRVRLDVSHDVALSALSGGQRTRAALAALVFADPDFLLLDEPTNNLDRDGRRAVIDLLAGWRAGAIVVSHDRELLDTMDATIELTSLGATRYGGNWTRYRTRKARELASAQRDLSDAEKRIGDLARRAQATAERQARRDRAGRIKSAKGGAPRIALGGMKDRSEDTGGEHTRLAERQQSRAEDALAAAREHIEILQPLSVAVSPTGLPAHRMVLQLDGVSFCYPTAAPIIRDLSFFITGPERVAVIGPNGSGKTTLLGLITGVLQPVSGAVRMLVDFAMLDQQVSLLDPSQTIRDNFRRLHPQADENACRAALARFMFRADAALQIVGTLSGGQMLRAGLACVMGGVSPPQLLILDEPTNHLDVDSIEAVEAGLRAYEGALVIVSHDETFLENVRITRRLEL